MGKGYYSIDTDIGPQDMIQEIIDIVEGIDTRIATAKYKKNEIMGTVFKVPTTVRQIVPGQMTLSEPFIVPEYKRVSHSTDLIGGNSETILSDLALRVRFALANLDYKAAKFVVVGAPIYQGEGMYAISWGLMVEV